MRSEAGSLEYAHARIGARWGARPDASVWRRIEIARELPAMLEAARASALARWLEGVAADADVQAIEAALRRRWREAVAESAAWMPPDWRDAIDWCARLADLAAVQAWARGQAPAWLADDPWLRDLEREAAAPSRGAQSLDAAWRGLLVATRSDPASLATHWWRAWQALWPPVAAGSAIERELLPLLRRHAAAFAAPSAADGWGQRRALEPRLALLLRRHPIEPVAAFAYLALQALELERLRAEWIGRAAFPHRVLHA